MNPLVHQHLDDPANLAEPARTEEDRTVWLKLTALLNGNRAAYRSWFSDVYLDGIERLALDGDRIPTLAFINVMLRDVEWQAVYVDGLVTHELYAGMQTYHVFPVARGIRPLRNLLHSGSPDFIHDLIGHLPMLFDERYRTLTALWATKASCAQLTVLDRRIERATLALMEAGDRDPVDPQEMADRRADLRRLYQASEREVSAVKLLGRFYTWAIEMGLLRNAAGGLTLIGSAALSSPTEQERVFHGGVDIRSFRDHALSTPVDYSRPQDCFFLAESFDEYFAVLEEI